MSEIYCCAYMWNTWKIFITSSVDNNFIEVISIPVFEIIGSFLLYVKFFSDIMKPRLSEIIVLFDLLSFSFLSLCFLKFRLSSLP